MTIAEMHVWFRQYAQQMGMQNVRAILPEQIDLLINSSITDTINQIITQNIGITNDRIITDNSKIGQINALRSLYKVKTVQAIPGASSSSTATPFVKGEETHILRMYADIKNFDNGGSGTDGKFDYLYLVDLAINYSNLSSPTGSPTILTNYFPVRLIDDAYLADTLNDFVLRPRLRTPIAVIYNDQIDIYTDEYDSSNNLPEGLTPHKLRVSYIAKPALVAYKSDLGGTDVNCDLPEYMHVDILKHAVDLYRIAVSGALSTSQQAEQNQQRENARNNYRNEGNQTQ